MTAERSSLVPCNPWLGHTPYPLLRRREGALPPAIVAPRYELTLDGVGRLNYYSNVTERGGRRGRALVLVHGVHVGASSHELRHLFEQFRDERAVFALDLPGFGRSACEAREWSPELYVAAVDRLVDVAAHDTRGEVDLLALGLSAEFAAKVAARLPERVASLTLVEPTGFDSEWERSRFEARARQGRSPLTMALVSGLGLSSLLYRALRSRLGLRILSNRHDGLSPDELVYSAQAAELPRARDAALAYLRGALYPRENPQAIYTRVHTPTLVLTSIGRERRYGALARFVKWRQHFSAEALPELAPGRPSSSRAIADSMRAFWKSSEQRLSHTAARQR